MKDVMVKFGAAVCQMNYTEFLIYVLEISMKCKDVMVKVGAAACQRAC